MLPPRILIEITKKTLVTCYWQCIYEKRLIFIANRQAKYKPSPVQNYLYHICKIAGSTTAILDVYQACLPVDQAMEEIGVNPLVVICEACDMCERLRGFA